MKRSTLTAIVVILSLVVISGCSGKPGPVGEWSGRGTTQTPTFDINRGTWEISWTRTDSPSASSILGIQMFSVCVYREGATGLNDTHAIVVPPGGAKTGSGIVHGKGKFYIMIIASPDQEWEVSAVKK